MKKTSNVFCRIFLFGLFGLCVPVALQARTWTDEATKRTLEGDFVEVVGAKVVIKLETGRVGSLTIDRLIDEDKEFIKAQTGTPVKDEGGAELASGPLTRLTPPVSVKPRPIQGEGKKRKAGIEVTNNSDEKISKVVVNVYFLKEDGSVGKDVPHTESWSLGNPNGALGVGESDLIKVSSFFMEDDTASVGGMVTHVEWKNGTVWPTWTGPAPKREGGTPVAAKMIGVLGEGDRAEPVVAVFNLGSKDIKTVMYSLAYLDADGKNLGWSNYGYSGAEDWLPAGKGSACVGGSKGPPEGTVDVTVTLSAVIFDDETVWKPAK